MSKWKDVEVDFTVELADDDCCGNEFWYDLTYEKALPESVQQEVHKLVPADCHSCELDFDVRSSGYFDPGCMYLRNGDPGYPPEGDDERTCEGVTILVDGKPLWNKDGKKHVQLSKASADLLASLYEEEIQKAELPEEQPDCDRGDYEYDRWKDGD